MIETPIGIIAVLLVVLATLFTVANTTSGARLFRIIPLLVFAYFVPTLLSNTGIIPIDSPAYDWIKQWLLPASLILLTLSVDIPAIMSLGKPVLILFFTATAGILIGGPLAYLAFGWLIPPELGDQAWKGMAALSGSWIGGGANFLAIGESVGATDTTLGMMVIVDVAVANVWMAVLLYFAGRSRSMDQAVGANRNALEALRIRVQAYHDEIKRPSTLPDLMAILAISIGGAVLSHELGARLPQTDVIGGFVWVAIIATTVGIGLSFTPARKLEGTGASAMGSVFLYLLVATIGAQARFSEVVNAPALVLVGAVWMLFHAITVLTVRWLIRAPIFFAAVGSQANVGGAASAPVVAAAFHPSLAPVGVLLAVGGYVLGTYVGLVCAFLLELVHGVHF